MEEEKEESLYLFSIWINRENFWIYTREDKSNTRERILP